MTKIVIVIVIILSITFSVIISWYRSKMKRTMEHMNQMLDDAISGSFEEKCFDESMLSSVETRMAHYLATSVVSSRNLMEEKNKIKELISDISHQTKTPVSNLLLYCQLLEESELDEDQKQYVQAIQNQTRKLNFLISALIETSRLENGILVLHPQNNSVRPLLENLEIQIRAKAATKDIELIVQTSNEYAVFDPKWTSEALYNIADNAVKYTPNKGKIEIYVTKYEMMLRIDIIDNGIGISEEEQAKIFGRFYRSIDVRETEGVGIGLFLSRQIINQQNGYIKVSSQVGEGSVFSVFLPIEIK